MAYAPAVEDYKLSKIDREHLPPARRANAQYVEDHNIANWPRNNWNEQQLEARRVQRGFK